MSTNRITDASIKAARTTDDLLDLLDKAMEMTPGRRAPDWGSDIEKVLIALGVSDGGGRGDTRFAGAMEISGRIEQALLDAHDFGARHPDGFTQIDGKFFPVVRR
jgi:hypothetical protein